MKSVGMYSDPPVCSWDVERAFQLFKRLNRQRDFVFKPVEVWQKGKPNQVIMPLQYERTCALLSNTEIECDAEHMLNIIEEMDTTYMNHKNKML